MLVRRYSVARVPKGSIFLAIFRFHSVSDQLQEPPRGLLPVHLPGFSLVRYLNVRRGSRARTEAGPPVHDVSTTERRQRVCHSW
jgi:hypothetical protein